MKKMADGRGTGKAAPEVRLTVGELAKPSTANLENAHERAARLKEAVRNAFKLLSADGWAEPSVQMLDTWQAAFETGLFPLATGIRTADIRPVVMIVGGLRMMLGAKEQVDRDLAIEVMHYGLMEAERYALMEDTAEELAPSESALVTQ